MNIKKLLQKHAEKDAEVLLTEEDELFIRQLVKVKDNKEKAEEKNDKSKKRSNKQV